MTIAEGAVEQKGAKAAKRGAGRSKHTEDNEGNEEGRQWSVLVKGKAAINGEALQGNRR